jgi:phosphate starvation-inducible membrane PsiE|tara:strand:+ start:167 stop:340 length:174 start_codon:yes stop_codon:yes gene_type:complete
VKRALVSLGITLFVAGVLIDIFTDRDVIGTTILVAGAILALVAGRRSPRSDQSLRRK